MSFESNLTMDLCDAGGYRDSLLNGPRVKERREVPDRRFSNRGGIVLYNPAGQGEVLVIPLMGSDWDPLSTYV